MPNLDLEWLRDSCLAFPAATEQLQWGDHLLFKVGGKMFAITSLVPSPVVLSLKTSAESFAELTERPNIIPAPYLARASWIALETSEALSRSELAELLRASYDLVFLKLPKSAQSKILGDESVRRRAVKRHPARKKSARRRPR